MPLEKPTHRHFWSRLDFVDTLGRAYMGVMERRKRRAFTRDFKAETVRLVVEGGRCGCSNIR